MLKPILKKIAYCIVLLIIFTFSFNVSWAFYLRKGSDNYLERGRTKLNTTVVNEVDPELLEQFNDRGATGRTLLLQRIGIAINAVLGLIGTILLLLILYAGFLWLTAGGNEQQVMKAKKYIINSIIGVIIVSSAYLISSTIMSSIVG